MMTHTLSVATALALSISAVSAAQARPQMPPAQPTPGPAPREIADREVPFQLVTSLDNPRPIIIARFNGHPMPMMVHSNAGFFSQLKHAQAAAFGVVLDGGHESYGIDRPGHVSSLGLDRGTVGTLAVGPNVDLNAPVTVFEVPQDDYGMLGVGWLRRNHVVVDFAHKVLAVAPTPAQSHARAAALLRAGYVAAPMSYDHDASRYTVRATLNGITRTMTVATASQLLIDSALATAAHVRSGEDVGAGSGPTGAHVPEYRLASPVRITVAGLESPPISEGRIEDSYGYDGAHRPADPAQADGGALGGPFLIASHAVVDFGESTLYLKRGRHLAR